MAGLFSWCHVTYDKQITRVLVGSIESIKTEIYNYHIVGKFGESYKIHQTKTIQTDLYFSAGPILLLSQV